MTPIYRMTHADNLPLLLGWGGGGIFRGERR